MHNIMFRKIGHLHYRLTFHGHTHCFSFVATCLMHVLHLTHVRHGVVLYHNQIVKILACINVPSHAFNRRARYAASYSTGH